MIEQFKGKGPKVQAIIFVESEKPKKYSYVVNSIAGISTFMGTMKRKFPNAEYVNFYTRPTATDKGRFIERIYLL